MHSSAMFGLSHMLLWLLQVVLAEQCAAPRWLPFTSARPHVAALILARGGSQGVPLKNVAMVNGRTLLARAITAIREARAFDAVWVSTDHVDIATAAEAGGARVHWRAAYTAHSAALAIVAVQEFMQHHLEVDVIALIQCTSPFQRARYLRDAVNRLLSTTTSPCLFSVTRTWQLRWHDSLIGPKPINFDVAKRPRRQDWPGDLVENGMFYLAKRHLIRSGVFQTTDSCLYVEIPEADSYEIDTHWHLELAQAIAAFRDTY